MDKIIKQVSNYEFKKHLEKLEEHKVCIDNINATKLELLLISHINDYKKLNRIL